ncbi:MAG TPA: LamG-like jellyroll fold domain-containing protein [Opitutaceae bacterium]|nr:LamG-like jellyroll fold domain-containing protein [Opitutaceae bacterium]
MTPLRHRLAAAFFLGAIFPAGAFGLRAAPAASASEATLIWRFDNTASIGGLKPEVLGAPQVVKDDARGTVISFDGERDALVLPVNPIAGWPQFTIEVLLKPDPAGPPEQRFFHIGTDNPKNRALLETRIRPGGQWCLDAYLGSNGVSQPQIDWKALHPAGQWYWAAMTCDGHRLAHYVNGHEEGAGEFAFVPLAPGKTSIGVRMNRIYWFKGCIAEARFHPVALAPSALQSTDAK